MARGVVSAYVAAAMVLAAAVAFARGATWYVSVDGSDDNGGSAASPFRTLGRAAHAVVDGDTVLLLPGKYSGDANAFEVTGVAVEVRSSVPRGAVLAWTGDGTLKKYLVSAHVLSNVTLVDIVFYDAPTAITFDRSAVNVIGCEFQRCGDGIHGQDLGPGINVMVQDSFFNEMTTSAITLSSADSGALTVQRTTIANSAAHTMISLHSIQKVVLESVVMVRNSVTASVLDSKYVGVLHVAECSFAQNKAREHTMYVTGALSFQVRDSVFAGNVVSGGGGGGASFEKLTMAMMSNASFTDNVAASRGGALYMADALGMFVSCHFVNNSVSGRGGGGGGALYLASTTTLVTDSVFEGNNGGEAGGAGTLVGTLVDDAAALELTNCKVIANVAEVGGAFQCAAGGALLVHADDVFGDNKSTSGDDGACSFEPSGTEPALRPRSAVHRVLQESF
eukprot:TRINITY_DN21556_c0_g1_i1.p1 TRINITY_DN21556_c0_g1~~TRINITY_DN21556_c0_g1_i1.p1  ORF type:complete len:450 (+),score=112.60 TRINITY_DN21556_c0_g1_i1:100-1449(+)